MDARGLVPLLAIAILTAASAGTTGAPQGAPTLREVTLEVTRLDDGSLAYNGQVPGPTLDVNLGDTLVVRLVNHLDAPVSFHVHGMAVASHMDGMDEHLFTQFVPSVAPPGGEFTYTMRAALVGAWHYHDHAMGEDGSEGAALGLYGALLVRNGAEPRPDRVLDLHLLDAGPNGGRGLDATVPAGSDFEIALAGLGDRVWDVELRDPSGALVGATTMAPGLSDRFRVDDASPGAYVWTAKLAGLPRTHSGTVSAS